MSFQTFVTQRLAALTSMMNSIATNAKKIEELPEQTTLDTSSKIHVSKGGISESLEVQKIIDAFIVSTYKELISVGSIIIAGQDITLTDIVWRIDETSFTANLTDTIPLSALGNSREDIFVGLASGIIVRIAGFESDTVIFTPPTPSDAVFITKTLVTDSNVGVPTDPNFGSAFFQKQSLSMQTHFGNVLIGTIGLGAKVGAVAITGTVPELGGFQDNYFDYVVGSTFYVHNRTPNNLKLNNRYPACNLKMILPEEEDLIVKSGYSVLFVRIVISGVQFLQFVACGSYTPKALPSFRGGVKLTSTRLDPTVYSFEDVDNLLGEKQYKLTAIGDIEIDESLPEFPVIKYTGTGGGAAINDAVPSLTTVYSSEKTEALDTALLALLRDGVATGGNTLKKLYNLFISSNAEIVVADVAERDLLDISKIGTQVFVTDDGDGKWALYRANTLGVGATFIKLSDPDLLNAVMSNSAIKSAYESNADTNAFTNALKLALENTVIAIGTKQATLTDTNFGAFTLGVADNDTVTGNDVLGHVKVSNGKWVYTTFNRVKAYLEAFFQSKPITVSSSMTAVNNGNYITVADCVISDFTTPTPVQGNHYDVVVINGFTTINGQVYGKGTLIKRIFNVANWETYALYSDDDVVITASTTIDASWNNRTVYVNRTVTLTVPASLPDSFKFTFVVENSSQITWAITAPHTWYRGTPAITYADSTGWFGKKKNSNEVQLRFN